MRWMYIYLPKHTAGKVDGLWKVYGKLIVKQLSPLVETLLCFMRKSITGQYEYKDIVAIYPMVNLIAEKLSKCFTEVRLIFVNYHFK